MISVGSEITLPAQGVKRRTGECVSRGQTDPSAPQKSQRLHSPSIHSAPH